MCFVFIWEQTATCATYIINWLVFITEMKSVYCAVRTGSLTKAVCASYLAFQPLLVTWWTCCLPERFIHRVVSSASAFNFECPVFSLDPSNSCLHLPHHLPLTYILSSIFYSVMCFRRLFLLNIIFSVYLLAFSLSVCNTPFFTRYVKMTPYCLPPSQISKLLSYFLST